MVAALGFPFQTVLMISNQLKNPFMNCITRDDNVTFWHYLASSYRYLVKCHMTSKKHAKRHRKLIFELIKKQLF